MLKWGSAAAIALVVAACGLEQTGISTGTDTDAGIDSSLGDAMDLDGSIGGDSETSDANGSDVSNDGSVADVTDANVVDTNPPFDANAVCTGDAASCPALGGSGWTLVQYQPNRTTACAAGFTTVDKLESPTGGSCACGACTVTMPPDCTKGSIAYGSDDVNSANCTDATGTLPNTPAGSCETLGTSLTMKHFRGTPPAPTGGACSATATMSAAATATQVRLCQPQATTCEGQLCAAATECLARPGDMACPGAPYVTKHLLGDQTTVSCGPCGCATVDAKCTGSMHFFTDPACATGERTVTVDGTCNGINAGVYASHMFVGALDNSVAPTCTASSTATAGLDVNVTTVCCR